MSPARCRLALSLALVLSPQAAQARRVFIADGTAGPDAQASAAFMVFLPIVAVLVFALARGLGWRS